jgi:hypothetical protein
MEASKAESDPLAIALERLAATRVDGPVHARAGYGWRASSAAQPAAIMWVVGELDQAAARQAEWQAGETAAITLSPGAEGAPASADARLSSGSRAFMIQLPSDTPIASGSYTVTIVWRGPLFTAVDSLQVSIPPAVAGQGPSLGQPLWFRRGPFTGITFQPTAEPRFRRQERLRIDLPVAGVIEHSEARLLDRAGHPLPIPIAVARRDDNGAAFVCAELALAALALGAYLVEVTVMAAGRTQTIVTAFRLVT